MFVIAALLMTHALVHQDGPVPALWLAPQGQVLVDGDEFEPIVNDGVSKVRTPFGVGYDFHGEKSGILFKDFASFKLTKNITVSAWINPRRYAPNGQQSEIVFRGDDRNGLDPYTLLLMNNGTVNFGVENDQNEGASVGAQVPLNQWTHVTASFNGETGGAAIWTDGVKIASLLTDKKPIFELDAKYVPGIGIGNVQNNKGPHNQPFDGTIADVRLYAKTLTPLQVGYQMKVTGITSGGASPK